MRPAVFLDRDGTLIEERNYLDRLDLIAPFDGAAAALARLRDAGFALVVVTNQAGVARGYFDEGFVRRAHEHLAALFARDGIVLDGYYYCPHHPEGIVEEYRRECRCRKPAPGMIEDAARDLDLDVARSFVIGDKWIDLALARNAGARGILVRTGYGASEEREAAGGLEPFAVVDTLADAAEMIVADTHAARRPE